ncbi:MAG: flagellar motor switch protein FliM [Planctomycetales bacterium]
MADVLSQSEVESLLAALDRNSSPGGPRGGAPLDGFGTPISVYDFKRPERVSKEQMRAFQALHEGFSREFGAALSGMLRTIIEVKLISVDQLTYSEFVFSLENPTCFNLLESKGLEGNLILDLNPSIIFPIIDRLLGGGKQARHSFPTRGLTEIELRLVSRITGLAIKGLDSAWANICQLGLRVAQIESNPQLVQIVPPNEVIVLVSFEITMGEMRGIMNLCIPFNTIEPLSGKLSSDTWSAYTKRVANPEQLATLETGLSRANVEMTVNLAGATITAHELMNLAVGDVIVTEKDKSAGLQVLIEGRPMFEAHAGVHKQHKAIRISRAVARPKDLVAERLKQQGGGG